jgi:sulfatase maturation enzyme AslB (radical SAM superfamily)
VKKFTQTLIKSPRLRYLHFLGGETLIIPAFRTLLQALLDNSHTGTHLGFTTNLTVWPEPVIQILMQFQNVHVNVSVESLTDLNDYVRWPSDIATIKHNLQRWQDLCVSQTWWLTLRVTPTCLTVHDLVNMYEFAAQQGLPLEACNFLERPDFMRPTALPGPMRTKIADDLENWCDSRPVISGETIYNTRHRDFVQQHLVEDARSYCRYLREQPDESAKITDLVRYLRRMDQHRGNSVLDYLPQYAELFRTAGY